MRNLGFVLVLCLSAFVPSLAWGDSFFNNKGGNISGTSTLTGNSTLVSIGGVTGSLGTVHFKTGALVPGSGSLALGGVLSATGSTFTIKSCATCSLPPGIPQNAILFTGTFTGPITWVLNGSSNCTSCSYTLTGSLSGTWFNGMPVSGATTQLTIVSNHLYGGSATLGTGQTEIKGLSVVPEPGSLGLMGTGLIGIATLVRRKFRASR